MVCVAVTDANGIASSTFTLTARGPFTVTASYAGNDCLEAVFVSEQITVYQKTQLSASTPSGVCGDAVVVSASLSAVPGGAAVMGESIVFDFGSVAPSQSAPTDANGVASVSVVFPSAASYTFTASYDNCT